MTILYWLIGGGLLVSALLGYDAWRDRRERRRREAERLEELRARGRAGLGDFDKTAAAALVFAQAARGHGVSVESALARQPKRAEPVRLSDADVLRIYRNNTREPRPRRDVAPAESPACSPSDPSSESCDSGD
jgi:hypothetical protein